MKKAISIMIALAIVIGSFFVNQNAFANEEVDNLIRVKLTKPIRSKDVVSIYSDNGFSIYDMDNLSREMDFLDFEQLYVTAGEDGEILMYDKYDDLVYSFFEDEGILITSTDGDENMIKVESKRYRDYITFKTSDDGLVVLNYVDLENYLRGVVGSEMGPSFELEALKAQAIASRTYTVRYNNKHKSKGYDLCDTTHCHVYGGMDVEYDIINEAVDKTRGMIITYNGKPIDAVYYSNSGGYTANAKDVWGNDVPYLVAVKDDYSLGYKYSSWNYKITSDEISSKLSNNGYDVGKVLDIEILKTTIPDGRVSLVKITGTRGEKTLTGTQLRTVLGASNICSTLFSLKKDGQYNGELGDIYVISNRRSDIETVDLNNAYVIDGNGNITSAKGATSIITEDGTVELNYGSTTDEITFTFEGRGNGHGVGMSQYGAQGMAKEGYSYEDILEFYYTGIDIDRLR